MKSLRFLAPLLCLGLALPAHAHFLWLSTAPAEKGEAQVQVCFSEEAAPGEADLVDRVAGAKVWVHDAGKPPAEQKVEKQVQDNTGFWGAKLPLDGRALTAQVDYGVISRGGKTFMLVYYAKYLDATQTDAVKNFARTENLKLDLVPEIQGEKCVLRVLFDGRPAPADSQVVVLSPAHDETELKTNSEGEVSFALKDSGQYAIRARVQHDKAGTHEGKEYPYAMHYSTLTLKVNAEKAQP